MSGVRKRSSGVRRQRVTATVLTAAVFALGPPGSCARRDLPGRARVLGRATPAAQAAGRRRQGEEERRARVRRALGPHAAAVRLHDAPHDREADPGAVVRRRRAAARRPGRACPRTACRSRRRCRARSRRARPASGGSRSPRRGSLAPALNLTALSMRLTHTWRSSTGSPAAGARARPRSGRRAPALDLRDDLADQGLHVHRLGVEARAAESREGDEVVDELAHAARVARRCCRSSAGRPRRGPRRGPRSRIVAYPLIARSGARRSWETE